MSNSPALILKICFIFLIFVINFSGGLIPLLCKRCTANPKALSLLNAFASGVFLAMALVHIQPEAVSDYISIRRAGCPGYTEERRLRNLESINETTSLGDTNSAVFLENCNKPLFPLPYMLFFVGYLVILIVDRVILRHSHSDMHNDHDHGHSHSNEHEHKHEKIPKENKVENDHNHHCHNNHKKNELCVPCHITCKDVI